ncbi:DUF2207 domain-containing protein [Lewinella sp. JB7]|uniref:DUF2207 domain-containing protein n=1 Tax=Lewinella sp. JB7 TaxID=2962887 RepID=UPI0020C9877F|nr:DUF2207 domain-containing protein [Lewinella sp. JB7]MCP9235713.1 DUF2207 domain-containing protein [Lewinella sp. JB7]
MFRSLISLLFCLLCLTVVGQERFSSWHAEIVPRADRSVDITETITVEAQGIAVKRGITRSLPQRTEQPISLMSVERDGQVEPHHTQTRDGLLTIFAGQQDVLLDPGRYTYRLTYRIENAIGQLDSLDELDVDLIGPDVSLRIDELTATVAVPPGAEAMQWACYTGVEGSTDRDCLDRRATGELKFSGRGTFGRGRSMSIAVGFQPGFFTAMAPAQAVQSVPPPPRSRWEREGSLFLLLLGAIGFGYYFYTTWRRHGVDPPAPHVGPTFEPPGGHSPAAIGVLASTFGAPDTACFTASLLRLATRGYLSIEPVEEGFIFTESYYRLRRNADGPSPEMLPSEQRVLMDKLFSRSGEVILKESYDSRLRKVVSAHHRALQERLRGTRSGESNWKLILPLAGIYGLTLVAAGFLTGTDSTGWAVPALIVFAIAGLLALPAYGYLIRKPSPQDVALNARIAAFRDYLSMGENQRKRLPNAPAMSPEHYEDLLPYAIALGIHTKWTAYFGDLLDTSHYRPAYYAGGQPFIAAEFGRSFTQVVHTSSTPVQSASSGGGGSVGGGSGGGGAGGW